MTRKIRFMDTSFRDGFQSVIGARVVTADFLPAVEAAVEAGFTHLEVGGGARFQSPFFYCGENAFDSMDTIRKTVGPDVNLQTLARGVNVVGLSSQSSDIIDLHAKMFKKHGMTTIRNFDALNDIRNISYSGTCIHNAGLKHQTTITMMGLPPNMDTEAHSPKFYCRILEDILESGMPFDSLCFKDASGTCPPSIIRETVKRSREMLDAAGKKDCPIEMHTHDTADMSVACYLAAIEGGAEIIDLSMRPMSGGTGQPDILTMWQAFNNTEYTLDIDVEKNKIVQSDPIKSFGAYTVKAKLGYEVSGNVLTVTEDPAPYVGFGYIVGEIMGGVKSYIGYWFPKCQFGLDSDSASTKGENTEFNTNSLTGEILGVVTTTGGKAEFYYTDRESSEATVVTWLKGKAGIT